MSNHIPGDFHRERTFHGSSLGGQVIKNVGFYITRPHARVLIEARNFTLEITTEYLTEHQAHRRTNYMYSGSICRYILKGYNWVGHVHRLLTPRKRGVPCRLHVCKEKESSRCIAISQQWLIGK